MFSKQVQELLTKTSTRSPYSFSPTVEMFLDTWARGDYVICFNTTENCKPSDINEVQEVFFMMQVNMFANLHCKGWCPHEFHRICNQVNLILDGRALVSVGQKWAFDDDDHWKAAQCVVEKNIRNLVRGTPYE